MGVQIVKNGFEVIDAAPGRGNALAPTHLAKEVRSTGHVTGRNIAAISGGMITINRLAVDFGKKDVSNRTQHGFRRAFEKIRDADEKPSIPHSNGVVNIGEAKELDLQIRDLGARSQLAIAFGEKVGDVSPHANSG